MAYQSNKTSALQTALKAAVDLAVAEVNAGFITEQDAILVRVGVLKDSFAAELYARVDEDNASAPVSSFGGGGGSESRGAFNGSANEAYDMVLNFGAFKGMTLRNVLVMTADEVKAYTTGKRTTPGLEYLKWLAANKDPKANFAAVRAKVVLDDFNATSANLGALTK